MWYKYIFKLTQDLVPTLLLTYANQITSICWLEMEYAPEQRLYTWVRDYRSRLPFSCLFIQTCDYLMFNVLLTHFFIAVSFIIYLYKGCYSILLLQEELLQFSDCCQWNLGITWVISEWIPSLSVSRFTSSFSFNSPLEEPAIQGIQRKKKPHKQINQAKTKQKTKQTNK